MPKITAGSNATVSVPAGSVVSVDGGLIRFEFPSGTTLFEGDASGQTFGPYSTTNSAVITSLIGGVDYAVTTPPYAVVPFTPNNAVIAGGSIDGIPIGTSQKLTKWRAALAGVRGKTGYAKIACVGDSETYGYYATAGNTNIVEVNYPTKLAEILNSYIPTVANSFFGDGALGNAIASQDPRISRGSWAATGPSSLGGNTWAASAGATPFAFTPTAAFDTIDIWYPTNSGLGTFTVNVDGGASLGTISCNAAAAATKTTLSTTLATHTINATWASGSAFFIGMDTYSSATKSVRILGMGRGGSTSADWASSAVNYSPAPAISALAPDLTILMLGVNDWINSLSVASYLTNMQAIITAAKLSGDVLLVTPLPTNPANSPFVPNTTQQQFVQAAYTLAASNNVPLLDMNYRFGGSFTAGSQWYAADGIHPKGIGYADVAASVAKAILI